MTIFAILMPLPQEGLAARITLAFPDNYLQITATQWLVSSNLSVIEVTAKIGIHDAKQPEVPSVGNGIVFATSSYFGRAPSTVWDWIKAKLEAGSANG
jgi:hypothetical protein